MPTPKLTPEYAADLWNYLHNDRWGQIRVIQERLDKLFFNRHDLGFKAKEAKETDKPIHYEADEVHSGLAADFILRLKAILRGADLIVDAIDTTEEDAINRANVHQQDVLNAVFPRLEEENEEEVTDMVVEDMLRFGYGGSFLLPWRSGPWADYPKRKAYDDDDGFLRAGESFKRAARLPLLYRHAPSTGLMWDRDPQGRYCVFESWDRPTAQVMGQYEIPDLVEQARERRPRTVRWTQVATDMEIAYFVGGAGTASLGHHVRTITHKLGVNPYSLCFGETTSSKRPEEQYLSLLHFLEELIIQFDRLLSMRQTAIRIWAIPTVVLKLMGDVGTDPDDPGSSRINLRPGGSITLLPGEEISFLVWTGVEPGMEQQMALIRSLIQQHSLPSVLYGSVAASLTAGYAINSLIQAAMTRLKGLSRHLGTWRKHEVEVFRASVRALGENIYVFNGINEKKGLLKYSVSEAKEPLLLLVQHKPELPNDTAALIDLGARVTQGDDPFLPWDYFMEKILREPDVQRVQDKRDLQRFKREPFWKQKTMEEAVRRSGILNAQEMAQLFGGQQQVLPGFAEALGQLGLPVQGAIPMQPNPNGDLAADRAQGQMAIGSEPQRPNVTRAPGGPRRGGAPVQMTP